MMTKKTTKDKLGKSLYLLGRDVCGYSIYLEYPSWDCGWYWGFGYIERYTNKTRPETARDIVSHTHWNREIVGDKVIEGRYIYHINDNPSIVETVLTDRESWLLSELMRQFYILRDMSNLVYRGSAGVSSLQSSPTKSTGIYHVINTRMLPAIFEHIHNLLT